MILIYKKSIAMPTTSFHTFYPFSFSVAMPANYTYGNCEVTLKVEVECVFLLLFPVIIFSISLISHICPVFGL